MALTKAQLREILSAAGVDSDHMNEAVDKIITGHTASIDALREERDNFKAAAEKAGALEKQLSDLKAATEGKDYEALKKEYEDYKDSVAKKETRTAKETAFKAILKDVGVPEKHYSKIIKYTDVDGLELDEKGNITTAKDLRKSIKDEWGDHIETTTTTGAATATPPKTGGGHRRTKKEIMEIEDTQERQAAWDEYLHGSDNNDE